MEDKRAKPWSAAGAARVAREARITTAKFLRDAPVARTWEMGKLMGAYQLHAAHLGDAPAAHALLFGGMGYRPPFPADWVSAAELVVADEARYLAEADLYILSPHMCDVVIAAAQTLTREDLELVTEDDLPSLRGLVVMPRPVIVRYITGDLGDDRAFTWRFPSQIQRPSPDGRRLQDMAAVRMSAYHDSHGPVRPDTFLDFAAQARAAGTPLPPLLLDAIRAMPLNYTATAEQRQALQDYAATARSAGAAVRQQSLARGLDENRVTGEYTSGDQVEDPDDTFMPRFLYAFWRLCDQQIATISPAPVNHSTQLLAQRARVSPEARTVYLRRTQQSREGGHPDKEWHHRWVVRMHKVRQWYPSLQQHKVIYRGPYIKGPDGEPLLGGETVQALIR
jgi:hypothetical protein